MNDEHIDEFVLTPKDVAEILDIATRKVHQLCQSGQLDYLKIGRLYRIVPGDLKKYIEERSPDALTRFSDVINKFNKKFSGSANQ